MPVGAQALPVKSEEPPVEASTSLFLVRPISCTASSTEEVGMSAITSTPSSSIQRVTMAEPTSGLFWWSPAMISMGRPSTLPPKSSTAIFAAMTEPGPAMSA